MKRTTKDGGDDSEMKMDRDGNKQRRSRTANEDGLGFDRRCMIGSAHETIDPEDDVADRMAVARCSLWQSTNRPGSGEMRRGGGSG